MSLQHLSIDTGIGAHWAAQELQPHICIQGNLDPLMLVAGGAALEREATRILDKLGHGPFIFNLGHGVVPQTPPENVARPGRDFGRRAIPGYWKWWTHHL